MTRPLKEEDPTAYNRWMEQLNAAEIPAARGSGWEGETYTGDPIAIEPLTSWVPRTYPTTGTNPVPYPGIFSGEINAKEPRPGPDVETLIDARIELISKTYQKLMSATGPASRDWDHEKMLDRAMEIVYDSMALADPDRP